MCLNKYLSKAVFLSAFIIYGCSAPQNKETTEANESTESEVTETEAPEDKSKRASPPAKASATIGDVSVKLDYSSPAVKEREIWGGLVPFDEVWRTGANEANVFQVSEDVLINGQKLPAGKYALFTVPSKEEWVVIFNKEFDQWGAFNYNREEDALRITVEPNKVDEFKERLTFNITEEGKVMFHWENMQFSFQVEEA